MGNMLKDILRETGKIAIDATRDVVKTKSNQEVQERMEEDILILIEILLSKKINDEEIIQLIQKYYEISYLDSENFFIRAKTIIIPCKKLETYLTRYRGYTRVDANDYIISHNIPTFLSQDVSLCKLDSEKLLSKLGLE